jgi:hypothetical protein
MTQSNAGYVAKIQGPSRKWRLEREFIGNCEGEIDLGDGVYELDKAGKRSYLAIVESRRMEIANSDMDKVIHACNAYGVSFLSAFEIWAKSKRRSSETFVETVNTLAAPAKRAHQQQGKRKAEARKVRVSKMTAKEAFDTSDAADFRGFAKLLEEVGALGKIAADLLRCQKSSTRAKLYGRSEYRTFSYERKETHLARLCVQLATAGLTWGWQEDKSSHVPWILYVDLPNGQVSFHCYERFTGPEYPGKWDEQHASEVRVIGFADWVRSGCVGTPACETELEATPIPSHRRPSYHRDKTLLQAMRGKRV